MNKVLELAKNKCTIQQESEPPCLASQYNKPEKNVAITNHQSRFKK